MSAGRHPAETRPEGQGRGKPHTLKTEQEAHTMKPIIFRQDGDWTTGHIGPFSFEVKHSGEPSRFGIDAGRISRLWLSWKDSYGRQQAPSHRSLC